METVTVQFSRLPFVARPARMTSDADGFVEQVKEAGKAVRDWSSDARTGRHERVLTEIVLMFAKAVVAESHRAEEMIAAGAGTGQRDPVELLAQLRTVTADLTAATGRLEQLVRSATDATAMLLASAGVLRGPPADAVEDERALYDE